MKVLFAFFVSDDKREIRRAQREVKGALAVLAPSEILIEDLGAAWSTPPNMPDWRCASCGGPTIGRLGEASKNAAVLLTRPHASRIQGLILHLGCLEKRARRLEAPAKN